MAEVAQWMVTDLRLEDGLPAYTLTKIKVDVDPDWKAIADELASALADLQDYHGVPEFFHDAEADQAYEAATKALERYKEARGHAPW